VEVETPDLSLGEPAQTTEGGNWVVGDTLIILFAKETAEPPDPEESGAPIPAGVETPPASPDDSAGTQTIERLLAIGDARSLYLVEGESGPSGPLSRNYLIGEQIDVEFREGKARRVSAVRAIGVYLEPAAPGPATVDPEFEGDPGAVPAIVSPAEPDSSPPAPTDSIPADLPEGGDA
jgi:hypothetical protein